MAAHTDTPLSFKDPYFGYLVISRDVSSGALDLLGTAWHATQAAALAAITAASPNATIEYLIVKCDVLSGILATV